MNFVFVSNYLNHHQIPFCNAMYELLGEDFAFVQTEPMEKERVKMGWQENAAAPYLKRCYESREECRRLIDTCRVVFFGGTDDESYIEERLKSGRTVIRYSERLYKTGQWKAVSPRGLWKKYNDHTRYRRKPVYMLCAGAYVSSDFHLVRAYPQRLLRWGYFPETRRYDVEKLMAGKKPGSILWAARFIDWKHPELPLETAKYLMEQGIDFCMDIVGGGELEDSIKKELAEYGLQEKVRLLGYRTPEEVRSLMEKADIYLVTSDRQEGWGAVVNEAMNSGCAVVADHMVGAVPFLIRQGVNGLIYRDGCKKALFEQTAELLRDRSLCRRLGENALETVAGEWNAQEAAKRLVRLCLRMGFLEEEDLKIKIGQDRDMPEPLTGPCSPAPVIPERRMYAWLMRDAEKKG